MGVCTCEYFLVFAVLVNGLVCIRACERVTETIYACVGYTYPSPNSVLNLSSHDCLWEIF